MSNVVTINVTPDKITHDPTQAEGGSHGLHITKDIYLDFFNVIVGRKKNYLLYQNGNLLGYCHSGSFGMDVVRSLMSNKIQKDMKYQIVVKKVEKMHKIYLYSISEGYIYNSYPLVEKYRLVEVPKVEIKYRETEA